ncbi:TatD DNase family protein [Kribbella aluminosa]|uniref:TatD DNase family protein n=1 Tax=Kribbella aluminosa TaxID=416017 RepID=A0ABS4UJ83_9ACTN|nr:TatD family hydrolase [Kribbella aluminosa]MBP2351727.1 TatD DNase family protein [Kribbella aluminosa]
MQPSSLPALDVHAHIAGDVSPTQLNALKGCVVFAMTRSQREATYAIRAGGAASPSVVWGLGTHPGVPASLDKFDEETFRSSMSSFAVVGEVGLDRRGDQAAQHRVLSGVLRACSTEPVLISVHSTGRTGVVLDLIAAHPHPGVILHWFNGSANEVERAADLGCYFSVNAAMTEEQLRLIPPDKLLTETDFPASTSRTGASMPGDTTAIETKLSTMNATPIRLLVWRNLSHVVAASGAGRRLPADITRYLS